MKNKHNKRGLSRLLCTFNLGCGVTVDSIDDGVFGHDEDDITIISYMRQAADDGRHVVRVLSDDTDIFVLLVYWTWRCELHDRLAVQMEKWDGVILDVNATCAHLGLFDVLGEERASQEDLMAVGEQFFVALYVQPSGSSMTQARYNLYTRKQGKPMRIMSLPPTDLNLFLHVKRAHLQMLLWKAADQLVPRTFPSQNMAGRSKTANLSKHL